jgi:hypothetical protein
MALFTTRQKQQLIGPVLLFLLVGGFIGALWQGNPVAITIAVIAVLTIGLAIAANIRKGRRIAAAKVKQERETVEAIAEVKRRALAKVGRLKPEPVTVNFQIPVMSDDTLESLTVRVMEHYAERGGTISVAEAKAMATKALSEQAE